MHQLANSIHALALQVLKGPSLYSVSLNRATDAAEMPYSLLGIHSNSDTSLADPLSEFAFSGPLQYAFPECDQFSVSLSSSI
jgi:hypothetical protein